ncbi:MAG: hypothetical protein IJ368_03955 [Oscillospiraceae bacterium]|nr:hypothetical protein [Oscillospiraceae bacterium]
MNTIIRNQMQLMNNLLSYRTRVEAFRLADLIRFVSENIDAMDFVQSGDIVFSILEEINEPNNSILDVELLIPVDRQFKSNVHYVFKPVFKLENAVMLKYCGKFSEVTSAAGVLLEYLMKNHMQMITKVYYVVRTLQDDTGVVDIMAGVNGNYV